MMIRKELYLIAEQKKFQIGLEVKFILIVFLNFLFLNLESQLQLAFINQIYFNTNPDDIFGSIQMDVAHKMVESIQLRNIPCPDLYSSPLLPPNFV
jgi:hypothetical protein